MCLLVNTYQTCALFGHPTNDANATGFDAVLCDEAKSNGNTFGMCKGAVARNIPDFSSPYCTECDEVDADIHEKTKTIMEANEKSGSPETSIITEEFLTHLRGLPIDRDRAPDVSSNDILEFLRIGVSRGVSEVDRVRAEVWAKVEKRRPDSKLGNSGETREIFARWLVSACKIRHVAAAMSIARAEGDNNRLVLLQLLVSQARVASIYRARLDQLGVFQKYLFYAGINKPSLVQSHTPFGMDSMEISESVLDASSIYSNAEGMGTEVEGSSMDFPGSHDMINQST
ncbi:hypothetical protein SCAR479_02072 [Seiridium cardinale]|uniref:Uncharacterized protein n=1 Tax=Seiridium cardinale TaxID=138064 RepID=A0ABR2Y4R4_9PEZI